ncbi:putative ATP-binding protein involved in virulence [Providencia alcalifaciens]|nr:putative ATP-binding protein involved in virulence [Providencia alcalifaciens]
MFLHPSWQQRVIPALQEAFPNIQFVVTTHSPQVLSTVPSECIRIISNGEVHSAPPGSQGAESSRLLRRIFGVETRPSADTNTLLLKEYEKLVYADQWDHEHAKKLRIQLNDIFAGEEPKLTELDLYIENRTWELGLEEDQ